MIDHIELKRFYSRSSNPQIVVYFVFMMTIIFTKSPLFKLCITIINLIDFGFHDNVILLLLFILYSFLSLVLMRFLFFIIFLVRTVFSNAHKK